MGINHRLSRVRHTSKRAPRRRLPLSPWLVGVLAVAGGIAVSIEPENAGSLGESSGASAAVDSTPDVVVAVEMVGMPVDLREIADWAVSLFEEAGLHLPPIRFVHHGGVTEPCQGRAGTHREIEGVSVIEICVTEVGRPTRVMVLHETAHAWAAVSVTPERKVAFQELRGWTHWRDYEAAPWHENGTDQAAEIMVWGLIDEPLRMARIYQTSCAELEAGYRVLTGADPLHGLSDYC